jgi:hypothetical protein
MANLSARVDRLERAIGELDYVVVVCDGEGCGPAAIEARRARIEQETGRPYHGEIRAIEMVFVAPPDYSDRPGSHRRGDDIGA